MYMALEQEPHGPEEPSISDSEAESDGDNERYETVGCHLAVKPLVQQKVRHEQHMAWGTSSRDPPTNVTEFTTYRPYTQAELVNLGSQFQQKQREPLAAGL